MDSIKQSLPTTLTTARLVLTTPTLVHVPDIARLANNAAVHANMSRLPFPYTEKDARFFVEEIVPTQAEQCYGILLEGETFMGVAGLHFAEGLVPELGYWLGEPYWGQGYATEAALALVAAARAAGATALRSRALLTNAGSRNVLRKAGFVETGTIIEADNNLEGEVMMTMRLEFDA